MPREMESDLRFLCQEARQLGASNAVAFEASDVVVDPRVVLKCQVPICHRYGNNLMCPPYVMAVSEFQEVLSKYTHAVLIQVEIALPEQLTQVIDQEADLASLSKNSHYRQSWSHVSREFCELIGKVEAAAFSLGYRLAAGLGAPCLLCDECVTSQPGEPCRHPFQARPSMEAVGIDVLKTAERAGVASSMPVEDSVVVHGLILVD